MAIVGVIKKIGDFLSSDKEIIVKGEGENKVTLKVNRKYFIPYYQRELRWEERHVLALIADIREDNTKLLGNIILAKTNPENELYEIIDGQQRITTLLMIIHYLKKRSDTNLNFNSIEFEIDSFKKYKMLIDANFNELDITDENDKKRYRESDNYFQRQRLVSRYNYIKGILETYSAQEARIFSQNLCNAEVNLIVSSGNDSKGMDYFLDVNLKGIKLEAEDIFKGYFFKIMSASKKYDSAVTDWENLKKAHNTLNESQKKSYPLTLFLEHYMRCTFHLEEGCLTFNVNKDFELTSNYKHAGKRFIKGDHFLTLFGYEYPQKIVQDVTKYINEVFLNLINNNEGNFKALYGGDVDDTTKALAFNCMRSVVKGKDSLVKAIMMKYGLELLSKNLLKSEHDRVFAAYFYCVLFSVLATGKKQKEKIAEILKANKDTWPSLAIKKGLEFFENAEFSHIKMHQKYLIKGDIEGNSQYLARCLALIYNSFSNIKKDGTFSITQRKALAFYNPQLFSTEHLFINKSGKVKVGLVANSIDYPDTSKKIKNSLYNFIFLPEEFNGDQLKNLDIRKKLRILSESSDVIKCAYSKKAIAIINAIIDDDKNKFCFPDWDSEVEFKTAQEKVEDYFSASHKSDSNHFLNIYAKFAESLLDAVREKITTK